MIYYVSQNGDDNARGTFDAPFKTISHAAKVAVAGDTVRVMSGVYREHVTPDHGGNDEESRIVFEAAEGEHPIIKGSEVVTDWEHVSGKVWKKVVPNSIFGNFNPFAIPVFGDWLVGPADYDVHLGDVYLNGVSLYEARDMDALIKAEMRISGEHFFSRNYKHTENIRHPENTVYQWLAEVGDESTTLFCNFGEYNPNQELTEISVRACCFFPEKTGVNYITVRGFEMAHGATQFAPPTGDQYGIIGPHWSYGWVIEDNIIHDSKCSGISLGKICDGEGNKHTRFVRKAGYFHQQEATLNGLRQGWKKGTVGSHLVRNNVIYDCGQTGIVGHMGAAFSTIEHNLIYNVNAKQEFWGHEVAGIKFHAALDTVIKNNNIHDCNLGLWLDWQAQGGRVTKNLFYNNLRDLFIEVTHGPLVVDNNILLSPVTLQNAAQGTAYVHNVMMGLIHHYPVPDRSTPYHLPHSTEVAGFAPVYGGDDRVLNNIILGTQAPYSGVLAYMGALYNKYTTQNERIERIRAQGTREDLPKFVQTPQPVYISGNAYAGYSSPFRAEDSFVRADGLSASISESEGEWTLTLDVPEALAAFSCESVYADKLGAPSIAEYAYEDSDGSPVDLSRDMLGEERGKSSAPGAFAHLSAGVNKFTVWRS